MSEKTRPLKPSASPDKSKVVNVPHPAGTTAPVNENPKTVEPPAETEKPASAAEPPAALLTVAPSTSN